MTRFKSLIQVSLFIFISIGIRFAHASDLEREFTVNAPQGAIFVRTLGEGIPLIVINGGPGADHQVFRGHFDYVTSLGYQLVLFDDIGRGRSSRDSEQSFSPQMTVNDIELVRRHLNAEKIVLAGHSYGGIPAMQYAIQYQSKVERLIMLNASYDAQSQQMNIDHVSHFIKSSYPEIWDEIMTLMQAGILSSDPKFQKAFYQNQAEKYFQWYQPENRKRMYKVRRDRKAGGFNEKVYLDIIGNDPEWQVTGSLKGLTISQHVKQFRIPTLIIGGRWDKVTTPEIVYRLHKLLPEGVSEYHMLEKSGHWPWVEQPTQFQATIEHFLNSSAPIEASAKLIAKPELDNNWQKQIGLILD